MNAPEEPPMTRVTRRTVLGWTALVPALPNLLIQPARAAGTSAQSYDGNIVVSVRMMGGNDGLNTVVPIRDDRYYKARPTIAIAARETLTLAGGDVGLHPSLAAFHDLMNDGDAGIVQTIGYPKSSRSHLRATQIWETGVLSDPAPDAGWLGRYVDGECNCTQERLTALQLGASPNRSVATHSRTDRAIGSPALLLELNAQHSLDAASSGPDNEAFRQLRDSQSALAETTRQVQRARKGSGSRFAYPQTEFGQALRWTADMIETECPTRAYALSIGSFENDAPSFDTHVDQLPKHQLLYAELAESLHAFARHLGSTKDFRRVLLMTFSDFGRQLPENRTRGTEHGDASVLFYAGGRVRPGLQGRMPDLSTVSDGGLGYNVDFRAVYKDVQTHWLRAVSPDLSLEPFPILREA
jgi:uncharacterized protein (DUF1501 family)